MRSFLRCSAALGHFPDWPGQCVFIRSHSQTVNCSVQLCSLHAAQWCPFPGGAAPSHRRADISTTADGAKLSCSKKDRCIRMIYFLINGNLEEGGTFSEFAGNSHKASSALSYTCPLSAGQAVEAPSFSLLTSFHSCIHLFTDSYPVLHYVPKPANLGGFGEQFRYMLGEVACCL